MMFFRECLDVFTHVRTLVSNELPWVKERTETLQKSYKRNLKMTIFDEFAIHFMHLRTVVSNELQWVKERTWTPQKSSKKFNETII